MLWRYAGSPVLMDDPGLSAVTDAGEGNALNPKQNATRAQVAAILMRYCQNVAK